MADDEIVEEEDDFDESDSETSVASEADDDETSRNLNYEGLAPTDLQMGCGTVEKDPVVYSLPARKLLIGDITDDIPESVKVVRIFTSSTFTGILIKNNVWFSDSSSKHLSVEIYRY